MNKIIDILSGIGLLIALFLILDKGTAAAKLVTSLMTSATQGIKVLQGRG